MSIIKKTQLAALELAGLSTFGKVLYEQAAGAPVMKDVKIDDDCLVAKDNFGGNQLRINVEGGGFRFVPLRRGVDDTKDSYNLVKFVATEARTGKTEAGKEWSVKKGQAKLFAM